MNEYLWQEIVFNKYDVNIVILHFWILILFFIGTRKIQKQIKNSEKNLRKYIEYHIEEMS